MYICIADFSSITERRIFFDQQRRGAGHNDDPYWGYPVHPGRQALPHFNRNRVIGIIGLGATLLAILSALVLQGPLWPAILLLLLYYMAIMMDSGALTAGVVKESDDQNRGSTLAAYSMFGFIGSIIGPPMIGFILDWSGGLESYAAWKWGIITMAAGSFAVFLVQKTLSKTHR